MARAWARLGLAGAPDPHTDPVVVRTAFRQAIRRTHPDVSHDGDATAATIDLTAAYRAVGAYLKEAGGARADGGRIGRSQEVVPPGRAMHTPSIPVTILDEDTIAFAAPQDEVIASLVEAAHRLGEIAYLDRSAGLLEIVVEFVNAPVCSVVLSTQGRATGATEVFVTVEALSMGDKPPVDAVTRLLLATLTGSA